VKARKHLEVSRKLYGQQPAPSISNSLELVECGFEMYGGNLVGAGRSASRGLANAEANGLSVFVAGCLTNVAMIKVMCGDLDPARKCLDAALMRSRELLLVRLSALDAFAQAALLEGDLKQCDVWLRECLAVIRRHRVPARSWYDLAHQLTRCAYYECLDDWAEIIRICDEVDPELARRQYKALRTSLLCAKARALAHLDCHAQADRILTTALRLCPRGAVDPLIVLEASRGVCSGLRGARATASLHFDRSRAAARAIGHRYHERWIERQQQRLKPVVAVPDQPTAAGEVTRTALLLTDVATILGAGHSIDLLTHRVASILQTAGLGARLEIIDRSGCPFVPEPAATWSTAADGTFSLCLRGSDRAVTISIRDVEALDDISLLKCITDIVQTAVNRTADTEQEDEDLNLWPRTTLADDENTVFRSPRMMELLRVAMRLAATPLPILITGETGTGKDVFARLIHAHSRVKDGPFVPFNCSAVPRDLVESQLFGHRRGAFTGALEASLGVVRSAERGTLFLDEIGDLDLAVQPKLLRFLESGELLPVGESRPHRAAVRLVAATNADLETLADQGRFRKDLFYRIGGARLELPPLRERKDEIPALASLFLTRFARECTRTGLRLGDDFIAALLLYDWPGNIRELANEIRRAVAMASDGDTLSSSDLAPAIVKRWNERPTAGLRSASDPAVLISLEQTLGRAVDELEQRFIDHALALSGGRVTEAAELLGLSRKGLFLKRRRRGMIQH
jgi:DNA-binding NtrC family response regulator